MKMDDITNYSVAKHLRDGRTVTIRAVRPDDKGGMADGIREMSSESLYRRTFSAKRDLSERELTQLTEVDFASVVALVAVMSEEGQDRIVGGGRYSMPQRMKMKFWFYFPPAPWISALFHRPGNSIF